MVYKHPIGVLENETIDMNRIKQERWIWGGLSLAAPVTIPGRPPIMQVSPVWRAAFYLTIMDLVTVDWSWNVILI